MDQKNRPLKKKTPIIKPIQGEIWKSCSVIINDKLIDFTDFNVSNLGRVKRIINNGRRDSYVGKPMKQKLNHAGRPTVLLSILTTNGYKQYHLYTARLVAHAFLGPCPKGMEVDHKFGIKDDNRPSELEYVTHIENIERARKLKLFKSPSIKRGNDTFNKYSKQVKSLFKKGLSIRQISKELSIGRIKVKRIMKLMNLHRSKSESEKLKWVTQKIKKKKFHTKKSMYFAGKELAKRNINVLNQKQFTELTGIPYRILYDRYGSWSYYKTIVGLN